MILFLTAAVTGFLLVGVSMLFGGDADFDAGDMAGGIEHGGGGVLNLKVISMAICGWGVAGGIAYYSGMDRVPASLVGVGGAVVLGGLGVFIMNLFFKNQAPFKITDTDYPGVTGRTLYDIPKNGLGQVLCNMKGTSLTLMAKEEHGNAIPKDTVIEIVSKQGGMVMVRKKKD